jgi:signal transduction histidine kinase
MEWLVRADGSHEFRYVSEPAREYLGIDPADALRDSGVVWARVHPDDLESTLAELRAAAANRTGLQLEFRALHSDASYHYARMRCGPPTLVNEGVLYRSVVFDVTEQRRLEETVREAQRREAIGTLAAGMAHNFNNMLAVIVPCLEMVQATAPPSLSEDLEDARSAAQAATELVRQLMQIVRKDPPAGAISVDVAALVEEIAQMCRRTFDASIEIRCEIGSGPSTVLARRAELQQVIVNLCINARDALERRPQPRLELRVSAEPETVIVEVSDNGSGMSADVQRRVGEPFFSTKPPGRGTGLGLATAYGIVAELRGSLGCVSTPDLGTRFTLALPRHSAKTET